MIRAQIRAQVRERAQNACEYCHLHQDDSPLAALHVEHIIPKTHGGGALDNLALACIDCNLHKGTNLTGIDPEVMVGIGTMACLKVMGQVRFGFAVGCEAAAMPRRKESTWFAGYAPGSGLARGSIWAKGRTKGTAQLKDPSWPAGRSRRLTSFGIAVTK